MNLLMEQPVRFPDAVVARPRGDDSREFPQRVKLFGRHALSGPGSGLSGQHPEDGEAVHNVAKTDADDGDSAAWRYSNQSLDRQLEQRFPHRRATGGELLGDGNDRIMMLHITGYGLTGPKSERPGFGTLGEAMSGFAHITSPAGAPPTLPPFVLADGVASLNAAYAVMMALYHRDVHGGPGQLIDVNLIDPLARLLEQTLLGYDQLGLVPERAGNRWDISAPRNTYRTIDGRWLAMSGSSPALALRVFRAIGRSDLLQDADFLDPQRRLARAREVDAAVADWVATKTLSEAMAIFDAAEVAAAPVYDISDLVGDEQLAHRGVFISVDDTQLGPMTVQAPVPRFSSASGTVGHLGPRLGEHNAEVYGELLGLTQHDIDELHVRGVV
jgi:crotonobetainyl-CoA:carnitine CoA-transferase CaiB-like acyl-CoA transferase